MIAVRYGPGIVAEISGRTLKHAVYIYTSMQHLFSNDEVHMQ